MPPPPDNKPRIVSIHAHPVLYTESGDGSASNADWFVEFINSLPVIVWVASTQTLQFKFVSHFAETLLGYPSRLWIERPSFWKSHVYPEDREASTERRLRGIQNGNYDIEYRLVAKDGRTLWVRELGQVLSPESLEVAGVIVDLSQKRSPLQALGDGKIWLRHVIDSIPVQIWSGPADGTLDFFNARWRDELGIDLHSAQGDGWQQMLHPDDRERALEAWHHSVQSGASYEQQERHRMADGEYRWFLCRGIPMRDERGQIVRWFGSNTDINDQKRAEDALRRSEQQWHGVFENSRVGVALQDPSLHYVEANAAFCQMVGYQLDELQKLTCLDITYEGDRQSYKVLVDELLSGQRDHFEVEKRYRRKNGELVWARLNGSTVGTGSSRHWVVIAEDISERKRAEEAFRTSERKQSEIAKQLETERARLIEAQAVAKVGSWETELPSLKISWSEETHRIFGTDPSVFRPSRPDFLKFIHPEDRAKVDAAFDVSLEKHAPSTVEYRIISADGEAKVLEEHWKVFYDKQSHPVRLIGTCQDITERKHLDDALQQERDRLRLLLDLNRRLVSKLEVADFFEALRDGVRLAGWDWASILLPDPSSGRLTVYLSPDNSYLHVGYTLPIDGSLQGTVYRTGKPVSFRVEDFPSLCRVYRDNKWMQEIVRAENIRAGCALPLIHEGLVIGVLFLMTRVAHEPAKNDLTFLQELAALVATTLSNSLRFESVNESRAKLLSERNYLEADSLRDLGIADIIGNSPQTIEVRRQISVVAPTDSAVLITGETGTGKELIARAIHELSPRHDHSFIKVDCAAIPAALMESELFGHEKGAFTGATAQKLGRFELADHGTLFLDEVGDILLELQPKLLRVLQDHAFERLGSTKTRRVDVRIIAATHRELEKMVEESAFRQDLYYRLRVFPLVIPPLRDRASDIPLLVEHYVAKYARRMKKEIPAVSQPTMEVFLRYPWPGNVRELQHFIERSVVLTSGGQLQAPLSELQRYIRRQVMKPSAPPRRLEDIERESIVQALEESDWVVGGPHGAAVRLGLKRTTLASRMEKLGISRPRR